jgi:DNA-3-methyladenine glycosylase II
VITLTRTQFEIAPQGPFSLAAAATFWGGFTPAAHQGSDDNGHLHLAFPAAGGWTTVGVCLQQDHHSTVQAEVFGDSDFDLESVKRQTARILSLDVDARGFAAIADRDPVAADLQRRFPGLRPVCFYSPYEAAAWTIISHRITMRQAGAIKARIAEAYGETVEIHGERLRAFPAPAVLLEVAEFRGVFGRKIQSLHAIARAALAGDLDADYLRSLPDDVALARLRGLPGIGPFSAELILLRGAGHPDYLTFLEPRFREAVRVAYALDQPPSDDDLRRISDNWRPYRTWQTFLLRQSRGS